MCLVTTELDLLIDNAPGSISSMSECNVELKPIKIRGEMYIYIYILEVHICTHVYV